jgi:NitT/TauT family transport system substrate-binding protein
MIRVGTPNELILQEPFRAVFYTPFYAALARDAFARQGIAVTLITVGEPDRAVANLLSGAADLAWSGPMRVIRDHARDAGGSPLVSFGAVVMGDPFLLMGRGAAPAGFALRDLARLTLGTVSEVPTPWWCLQDDLRRAGVDPAALRTVPGRTMRENAEALARGEIDLAQLFEPFASELEARGVATAWHAQASRGPTSYTAFYATRERVAARRDAFKGMVRAMAETLAWLHATPPAEIAAAVGPRFFADLDPALLAAGIARYKALGIWMQAPRFPREAFERLEGAMLGAGAIPRAPGFAACVDTAIEAEALGETAAG